MNFRRENPMRQGMMRILGWLGLALSLTYPATDAQQERAVTLNGPANAMAAVGHAEADHTAPAERNPRYKICRDDVLMISFPLSPELNQKVIVQPDGFIALQSAGDIRVEGLTVPGAVEAVKKAYAGTLHDPIVDIDLTDFQKPFFTVLGQVGKPGQYDLRYDITVTQAIAVAGGFAATGKSQVFLYRAVSSNWAQVREIKLKEILKGKNIGEDVHLQPGDMIFVPEKAIAKFREYVPYSIAVVPPYPTTF
jgi:protein involved in polysaccharide export with SLBB domain